MVVKPEDRLLIRQFTGGLDATYYYCRGRPFHCRNAAISHAGAGFCGDALCGWGGGQAVFVKQAMQSCGAGYLQEQQPKAVKKWLNESYPLIKQRAQEENAEIYWGDEAGISSQDHYPRGYAPMSLT